jgi:hypothetical protein
VLSHYGIDNAGYTFFCVTRWARDRVILKHVLEAIQRTTLTIVAGREELATLDRMAQYPLLRLRAPRPDGQPVHDV